MESLMMGTNSAVIEIAPMTNPTMEALLSEVFIRDSTQAGVRTYLPNPNLPL